MSANTRPPPLFPAPLRAVCPVCGHTSYSSTGVHPQCAMRKADQERMQRIKQTRLTDPGVCQVAVLSQWQKICPRCKIVVHFRKKVCTCGHKFPVRRPASPK